MVENILGTNVSSPIVPFTTDDEFPTHDAKYGKGGFRAVQTINDRDNITDYRKDPGMFVYVIATDKLYYLDDNTWVEWTGSGGDINVLEKIKINGTALGIDQKASSISFSSTGSGDLTIKDAINDVEIASLTIGNSGIAAGTIVASGILQSGYKDFVVKHELGTDNVVVQIIDNRGETVSARVSRYTENGENFVRIRFSEVLSSNFKVVIVGNTNSSSITVTPQS